MASRTVYSNVKISCPICSKTMLLKNWKDHCQTKHYILLSEEKLKKEYENLKKIAGLSTCSSELENIESTINTLFSMKNFVLTKITPTTDTINDENINICISNDNVTNISASQDLVLTMTKDPIENELSSKNHQTVFSTTIYENMNMEIESMIETFFIIIKGNICFSGY